MVPPKRRKTDKHLPPRVYFKHKAYFFVTKENKWIRLGANFSEAIANWAKMVDSNQPILTMNDLFNRYMTEIAPTKAQSTYKKNCYEITYLRKVFGHMRPTDITAVDVYKYLDLRGKQAPISANREKSLLSHILSFGIRWGVINSNVCRNVRRHSEKPRTRYIEDFEFNAVLEIAPPLIKMLMIFGLLTAQRISDILKIKLNDLTEEGIKIQQNKTQKKLIILWSPELKKCVNEIKKLPRSNIYSFTLFCNSKGAPLTYEAFSTLWLKTMKKALKIGILKERFRFHDIRSKSASDLENLTHASKLLGHADSKITDRIYVRKDEKIKPFK